MHPGQLTGLQCSALANAYDVHVDASATNAPRHESVKADDRLAAADLEHAYCWTIANAIDRSRGSSSSTSTYRGASGEGAGPRTREERLPETFVGRMFKYQVFDIKPAYNR